jgi:hypothetical protein
VDGDHLLEQGPNEDWMDTMLRSGRVVYSQAAWGLANLDWSDLLHKLGRSAEAEKARLDVREIISAVNEKSWNDNAKSYSDSPEGYNGFELDSDRVYATMLSEDRANELDNQRKWLTQDASLFLLLVDSFNRRGKNLHSEGAFDNFEQKARDFLNSLKRYAWNERGTACVTPPSTVTGPFKWGPNRYQNGGFWPWISTMEILARIRYDASGEDAWELMKKTLRFSLLEWINPISSGSGAYPFRTSVAAVRTALRYYSKYLRGELR